MNNAVAFFGGAALLLLTYRVFLFQKNLKYLKNIRYAGGRRWPLVSLVIPACNEADTIRPALESLLKLNYPNYEIIAINDRSSDETGKIIDQLAQEDSRIKPVHINQLPSGWLGKVNAIHTGTQMANGEWLLFSDADVHFSSDALKKAVAYSEEKDLSLLAVSPEMIAHSFLLKAMICQFLHQGSLVLDVNRVEKSEFADAVGIGAFNLVRKEWLEKIGGLQSIKLDIIDDGALAYMIKKAGGRNSFLSGIGEISIEWYPNFIALVRGLEKNAYSMFAYSFSKVIILSLITWLGVGLCFILPFFADSPLAFNFYILSLTSYFLVSGISLHQSSKMPIYFALTIPIALIISPFIILRSALLCIKNGGISWRGTFYPLFLIRREQKFKVINVFNSLFE